MYPLEFGTFRSWGLVTALCQSKVLFDVFQKITFLPNNGTNIPNFNYPEIKALKNAESFLVSFEFQIQDTKLTRLKKSLNDRVRPRVMGSMHRA